MENKLAITIVALMVVALAAPAVMATNTAEYSATVTTGQNTAITNVSGAFGGVAPASDFNDNRINNSITCENVGNVDASVNATFTTSYNGTNGLTTSSDVIGGSNFELGDTNFNALTDSGAEVTLTDGVAANSIVTYDAKLKVPAGQAAGAYNGTVNLIFG